ncbi:MAG: hypothetical protein WC334_09790, partial [Kiritimatiellales bacterium]
MAVIDDRRSPHSFFVYLMTTATKNPRVLPGFGPTLGFTLLYLCLIVLIPLAAIFLKASVLTWDQFWKVITDPRVIASYKLTFGAALIGA